MKFCYVVNQDYHNFIDKIVIKDDYFFGKTELAPVFSDQIIIDSDYIFLESKYAHKLAFLLGEDLETLVKEYEKWKLKKNY